MLDDPNHYPDSSIVLHNHVYPVTKEGAGELACVCIGVGSLMQKTLSASFKEEVTLYSADTYWGNHHPLPNPRSLTMKDLIDDIFEMTRQLKLKEHILLSHSCYGILAIEAAKRQVP